MTDIIPLPTTTNQLRSPVLESESPARWLTLVQLVAIALHFPLVFVARNWRSNTSWWTLAVVGGVVMAVALLLDHLLSRRWDGWRALEVVSVLVMVFWFWDTVSAPRGLPIPQVIIGLVIGGLLAVVTGRFSDRRYVRVGFLVTACTLFSTGLAIVAWLIFTTPLSEIDGGVPVKLGNTSIGLPDIYILFVDGYARADVLEADYGFSNEPFLAELTGLGLQVAENAKANYSATHYSIPSVLALDYPATPGPDVSVSDLRQLSRIASGDNALVRSLKGAGYVYIHGSSDWWGNSCGELVDVCLSTPLIDIATFDLLSQTPVGPLLYPETGDPGTAVALMRFEQFEAWPEATSTWPTGPRLGIFHLLVPHPPLYLDSHCQPRLGEEYSQRRINSYPFVPIQLLELRKSAYIDQVVCANEIIRSFVTAVPDDAAVIVMSDHGPDSRSQIVLPGTLWSADARKERFGNLLAARIPCGSTRDLDPNAVNIGRRLLTCVFNAPLPDLPGRYFIAPSARDIGRPLIEIESPDN